MGRKVVEFGMMHKALGMNFLAEWFSNNLRESLTQVRSSLVVQTESCVAKTVA